MGLYNGKIISGASSENLTLNDKVKEITETIQFVIQLHREYTDKLEFDEEASFQVVARPETETMDMSDSHTVAVTAGAKDEIDTPEEDIGFAITTTKNLKIKFIESMQLLPGWHQTLGERVNLTEDFSFDIHSAYQDKQTITEVMSFQIDKTFDETVSVSEQSQINITSNQNEEIDFVESIVINVSKARPIATAGAIAEFAIG